MHRASTSIFLFVLAPAAIAFLVLPAFGILRLPETGWSTRIYLLTFYLPALVAAIALCFAKRGATLGHVRPVRSWPIFLMFTLASLYLFVSSVDLIFYHNVLKSGISEAWQTATQAGARSSAQGAVGLILAGAPSVLVGLALFNDGSWGSRRLVGGAALALYALSLVLMFAASARNSVAISVMYVLLITILRLWFYRRSVLKTTWNMNKFLLTAALVAMTIIVGTALWLFVDRAVMARGSIDLAIQNFLADYKVGLKIDAPRDEPQKQVFFSFMMLEFYLTHAASYLSQYMSTGYCPGGDGAYTFYGAFRIIDFILGTQFVSDASDHMILAGVYLSLPGFLYLDFCGNGVLAGWAMTLLAVASLLYFFRSRPQLIFICSYFLSLFVFAPFYALPSTGNGFSLLILSAFASLSGAIKQERSTSVSPDEAVTRRG